jgi:hypothetical protein
MAYESAWKFKEPGETLIDEDNHPFHGTGGYVFSDDRLTGIIDWPIYNSLQAETDLPQGWAPLW